jgi:hypothetical protein
MFSAREVAHLLAQRILFGMGHYLADDPFGQDTQGGRTSGPAQQL